jgi:hypothetical protein
MMFRSLFGFLHLRAVMQKPGPSWTIRKPQLLTLVSDNLLLKTILSEQKKQNDPKPIFTPRGLGARYLA